jgi:hypothetical protein
MVDKFLCLVHPFPRMSFTFLPTTIHPPTVLHMSIGKDRSSAILELKNSFNKDAS